TRGAIARRADFNPAYQPPRYDAPVAPPPVYNEPYAPPVYNAPVAPPPVYHAPPVPRSDYDVQPYGYYPPPRAEATEQCRTFTRPRIDEWGREGLRRVRVRQDVVG